MPDRHNPRPWLTLARLASLLAVLATSTSSRAHALPDPNDLVNQSLAYIRNLLGSDGKQVLVTEHQASIAADRMALSFTLATLPDNAGPGRQPRYMAIALAHGDVLVNEKSVGHYRPGGVLQASWRDLVYEASRRPTSDFVALAHAWEPEGLEETEAPAANRVHDRLASLTAVPPQGPAPQAVPAAGPNGLTINLDNLSDPARLEATLRQAAATPTADLRITIPNGRAWLGSYTVGSGEAITGHLLLLKGDANVYGVLNGNLVTLDGNIVVHPGGIVNGDVLTYGGMVQDAGGEIRGEIRTLSPADAGAAGAATGAPISGIRLVLRNAAGLGGVFLTLVALGFGLVLFGRQNLEIVADTVSHSFGRSFMVGLVAQMLLLPTFGMLVVGLALSVVGVLLIPFAVLAYLLLLFIGVVGGYLAAAHALGESYTRRRLALGVNIASPNSYSYLVMGLLLMLGFWAAWVTFGWVPVAGTLLKGAAIVVTWLLITAGFGAALLSRAGVREAFTGRIVPPEALTDEYLWATPQFGVPAAKRPARPLKDH
jgi:hypothetical protein